MNSKNPIIIVILIVIAGFVLFQFSTNFSERDYDAFCMFMLMSFFFAIAAISQFESIGLQKKSFYVIAPVFMLIFILLLVVDGFETMLIVSILIALVLSFILGIRLNKGILIGKKTKD